MLDRIQVKDLIARNAENITALQRQIHSTFERRSESPEALAAWKSDPEVDHLIGRKLSQKYRFNEGQSYQRQSRRTEAIAADSSALR